MIAEVTPYRLLQALNEARRRGGPTDYYGVGGALRGVGNDLDAATKSIIGINNALTSNEQANAEMQQGYYPALVAQRMAGMKAKTYDDEQLLAMKQAIEEAHRNAAQQGLIADTPEYKQFMNNYTSQHGGYNAALKMASGAREAATEMQNRNFAQQFVKKAVENELAKRIAQRYYDQHSNGMSLTPDTQQALADEAKDFALQQLRENQVQVQMDHDGNVTVSDSAGQTLPIEPQLLAAALSTRGNTTPQNVLEKLGADYQKYLMQQQKATTTATPKEKSVKATTAPDDTAQWKHYELLLKEMRQLAGKEMTPEGKALYDDHKREVERLRGKLYGMETPTAAALTTKLLGAKEEPETKNTVATNPFLEQPPDDVYEESAPALLSAPPGTLYGDRQLSTDESPDPYTQAIQKASLLRLLGSE